MWSCCGFRSKRRKPKEQQEPDERTALLDQDILPFVQPAPAKVVDDEALLEYQRRIDRILEEAAEKIANVSTAAPVSQHHRSSASEASGSTFSSIKDQTAPAVSGTTTKTTENRRSHRGSSGTETTTATDEMGHGHDRVANSTWRADQNTRTGGGGGIEDGSIYSMKKVSSSDKKSARGGKGKARGDDQVHEQEGEESNDETTPKATPGLSGRAPSSKASSRLSDSDSQVDGKEDQYGTIATYKTAAESEVEEEEEDGVEGTPRGTVKRNDTTKPVKRKNGKTNVQDVFSDTSSPEDDLNRALAMSEADFTRLLTRPA